MASRLDDLSRRERQIMDIVYQHGRATAAQVHEQLADPPSYSAVRASLRILMEKGHLKHTQDGPRYVYEPTRSRNRVRNGALRRVLKTFFGGSTEDAVAALLDMNDTELGDEELARLQHMIDERRRGGTRS